MKTELLDTFDEAMHHIGTATRDEAHQQGLWHQTVHCWIIRIEGEKKYILFQRRNKMVQQHPGMLDITAAGHMSAGEAVQHYTREIEEELGISVKPSELIPLGIRVYTSKTKEITNREFCHEFLLEKNIPLMSYTLQAEEVTELVAMELSDAFQLFGGIKDSVTVSGIRVGVHGQQQSVTYTVTPKDIIPRLDRYYLKVCIMAERYFAGNPYLAI